MCDRDEQGEGGPDVETVEERRLDSLADIEIDLMRLLDDLERGAGSGGTA